MAVAQGEKIREIQGPLWLCLKKRRHPLARWLRLIQVTSASFGCENALCPSQRGIGTASRWKLLCIQRIFWGCCNVSGKVINGGARREELLELNFS